MADVTIAPQDVVTTGTTQPQQGIAGVAMDAGTWVYIATDRTLNPARANSATTAGLVGITLNKVGAGGYVSYNDTDNTSVGAVLTKDVLYVLSAATAGKIAPYSDLASTNIIVIAGVAGSTSSITPAIKNTAIVKT